MNDVKDLWNIRVKEYWNEAIRYLRLIGNSGFLFTIYLLIIIGGYYYSVFLSWLPESAPVPLFFTLFFAFYLNRSPVRTFVKHGDLVFLLPLEPRLKSYFRASLIYSFIFQAFVIILFFIVLGPLFTQRIVDERMVYYMTLILLLFVKFWNVHSSWYEQMLPSQQERFWHACLRFAINVSFTFLLFVQASFTYLAAIGVLMVVLSLVYYRKLSLKHSLKWEHLLEVEERMLTLFYRVANAFTDVPKLRSTVKRRMWVNAIVDFIPFNKRSTFSRLYIKSFVRANDYFGVYIRLLVIAAILLAVVPEGFIRLLVFLLFLYMSGLQLSTLWHHHDTKIWVNLYPIKKESKTSAFSFVVFVLLVIKTIILSAYLFVLGEGLNSILLLLIGAIFSYTYGYKLVHRRKKAA
ncbi:ABC transporter permease [Bacillus sp. FJAT-45350]|uniref:ABC transporter permease n=1 Tax=Bacillus sp. FJAT-45350 TaxID=2011014 RepID=UPI000BB70A93|nr:ABC transporter permease [Bacillus sp. FJAT-45350]